MSKDIIFTDQFNVNLFPPKPAIKNIPDWYKNTQEYVNNNEKKIVHVEESASTIKKCMPVFDAMTAGYILYTQVDVQVSIINDEIIYHWADQNAINFHPLEQAPLLPNKKDKTPYPKWMNPYGIKTPPGYSILIVPPINRESIFTILPGIVDTDKYTNCINFPFVFNNLKWEGIIDAGTPMAQIIPFKRDSWKHRMGSEKERQELNIVGSKIRSLFFNSYKKNFWSKKEFN